MASTADASRSKNWVVGCWHGYLSGARCRLAYGQLMPLPLTVSCFSKIHIGFTYLVLAYPGSPGKGPLNGCVYVCVWWMQTDGRAVNDAVVDDRRTMAIDLQCIELAVWDGWVRTWIELQTYASPSHRHRQCTHKSTNPIQRELMGAKNPLCLHLHTITTHISKSWRYIWTDKPK